MNDEKLILAIKDRDEKAMAEVMQKYAKLLWTIASAVLVNAASMQDVEECVADVFIQLWQFPDKYDPAKGKLSSYLSMVTRAKAIDRYRQIVRKAEVPIDEAFIGQKAEMLAGIVEKEEKKRLLKAVYRLAEAEKEVVLRRYYFEQKPKEIAIALNMPKKQVENHLYQAKKKLRKLLEAQETAGRNGMYETMSRRKEG